MKKSVKVKLINKSTNPIPQYAHPGDAGIDLMADLTNMTNDKLVGVNVAWDDVSKCIRLFSGGRVLIPTGLYTEFPEDYVLEIMSRSGLALKQGIQVCNAPGIVDSSYRGEIGVILINLSEEDAEIYHGAKIAQAILKKYEQIKFELVDNLANSERCTGGFGSTGV